MEMSTKFHTRTKRFFSSGQSLIEVVIALGIVVTVLVTLTQGTLKSFRALRESRNRTQATELAEEALEATRTIRDRDFAELSNGTYGLQRTYGIWTFIPNYDETDIFRRTLVIGDGSIADIKQIGVTVTWPEGNGTETVDLHSIIAKIE